MEHNISTPAACISAYIQRSADSGQTYLCQWAPAACPGFLLVSFGTVGALTSFEFSESGQPPLNTGRAETQQFPPHSGMLILFESFLWILLLDPAFSSSILLYKFVQVFDTLKIPVRCFGTRDTLKKVICLILSYTLFLLLCHFIWIWTYKTHDLTDHQLIVRSFPPAITFMWSDW